MFKIDGHLQILITFRCSMANTAIIRLWAQNEETNVNGKGSMNFI